MKFIQSKSTGIWSVRFLTKFGRKQMKTGETDLERAKMVAKGANIEAIEMARKINLLISMPPPNIEPNFFFSSSEGSGPNFGKVSPRPTLSPIALPPKAGNTRTHKKLP